MNCIFSGIISIFAKALCTASAPARRLGRTMPAAAAILQWFDFSESYTNIFEGCAVFLESQPRYLGKIHPFAWLSIPFEEQAAFHKTISQKNAKNLHVILAWICLLRFFLSFFLSIVRNPTNSTNHQVCCTLCIVWQIWLWSSKIENHYNWLAHF